jgi:hypothetical protein
VPGCRLVFMMDNRWHEARCKTKHPERAKWITVVFQATPVGGLKRNDLARVVALLQPTDWERPEAKRA